jgi:hypothetical protein
MSKLFEHVGYWFLSKKTLSRRIAQVCALALKEIGLNAGGNVFELKNSRKRAGWLVSLQIPEQLRVTPVDALALRLFLSRRVEDALGMKPKSLHMVLSFNTEAKRLPFAESVIDTQWLKARMTSVLANAGTAAAPVTAQTIAPIQAQPILTPSPHPNSTAAKPTAHLSGSKPVSAPAKVQEEKMKTLLASLTDDDLYEVKEASMTDFDRALL